MAPVPPRKLVAWLSSLSRLQRSAVVSSHERVGDHRQQECRARRVKRACLRGRSGEAGRHRHRRPRVVSARYTSAVEMRWWSLNPPRSTHSAFTLPELIRATAGADVVLDPKGHQRVLDDLLPIR